MRTLLIVALLLAGSAAPRAQDGSASKWFGVACAWVSDVDGDRVADFAVADPGSGRGGGAGGRVTIHAGDDGELLAVLWPEAGERMYGKALAALDDLDGDGLRELAVAGERAAGEGRATFVRVVSLPERRVQYEIAHPPGSSSLPRLAPGPDVDGDGCGDLLVGVPDWKSPSRVALHSGADGAEILAWELDPAGDVVARSVAFVPDLDGDGREDVAIGVHDFARVPLERTRVEIRSSASGELLRTVEEPEPHGGFGSAIARLPDLSRDGVEEVVISAPGGPSGVYVLDGRTYEPIDAYYGFQPTKGPIRRNAGGGSFGERIATARDDSGAPLLLVADHASSLYGDVFAYRVRTKRFAWTLTGRGDDGHFGYCLEVGEPRAGAAPRILVGCGNPWGGSTNPSVTVADAGSGEVELRLTFQEVEEQVRRKE